MKIQSLVLGFFLAVVPMANADTAAKDLRGLFLADANEAALDESAINDYATAASLFAAGQAPNVEFLQQKMLVGRCYFSSDPAVGLPTAYLVRTNPSDGSIFEAASVWSMDQAPDYYDKMTFAEVSSSLVKPHDWLKIEFDTAGDSLMLKPNEVMLSKLRQSGQYWVEELSVNQADVLPVYCHYLAMNN